MNAARQPIWMTMLREVALTLALAVFVFRALLPAGFMPEINAAGGVQMVICSGFDQKTVTLAGDHDPAAPSDTLHKDACPFALALGGAPLPATPPVLNVPPVFVAVMEAWTRPAVTQHLVRIFSSRAPPRQTV